MGQVKRLSVMKKIYRVRIHDEYGKLLMETWFLEEPKKYAAKLRQSGNQVNVLSFMAWEKADD